MIPNHECHGEELFFFSWCEVLSIGLCYLGFALILTVKLGGGSGLNKIVSFSHRDTGQGIAICGP